MSAGPLSNRVRAALTTTVLATAATGFLASCGTEDEQATEQEVFCVDADGQVVDADLCDDDPGGGGTSLFFLHTASPGSYRAGDRVRPGSTLIRASDAAARARAGLPSVGKVAGTRVTGGIGSGVGGRAATGAGS